MQTRARKNIGYGTNIEIILSFWNELIFNHANSVFINEWSQDTSLLQNHIIIS